ncbi:hypothetical protein HY375_03930 [Candidatus Berkelbacteria bacterium]|nr:hypothetical protein [Candidatus Berkelbacteria bacterium]
MATSHNLLLYHRVPSDMVGTVLYPLNELKSRYPDIYAKRVQKYQGREWLLTARIPRLNCLWNDVLHLAPIHPQLVTNALRQAGHDPITLGHFVIPSSILKPDRTVVYWYRTNDRAANHASEGFSWLAESGLEPLDAVPAATSEYFAQAARDGQRPLAYHRIPHVLYRGSLETAGLTVVETT